LVHKAQNRNVLLLAGKACNKLPAYGRKKAWNPAGLRPVINTVIFLQGCRARLHGKGAICTIIVVKVWTCLDNSGRGSLHSVHAVWYPATVVWYPAIAVWYPATAVWYSATAVLYPATAVWYPATAVLYPATAVWYPATAVWYPATAVWYPATAVWYPATAV
jgi:hypothetical protein